MNKSKKILVGLFLFIVFISLFLTVGVKVNAASKTESVLDLIIMMDDSKFEDILLGELTQKEEINIIEADEIDQIEQAEEQGADFVITGVLINLGSSFFRLEFEAIDIKDRTTIYSNNVTGEREEIMEAMIEEIIPEVEDSLLTYDLRGQVVDEEGQPISGAEIKFTGDYSSVVTDEEGQWEKEDLLGNVKIEVEKEGWKFTPSQKEVSVRTEEVKFAGRKVPHHLEQIEVEFKFQGQRYIVKAEGLEATNPGTGTLKLMDDVQIKEDSSVSQSWKLDSGISYNFYNLEKFNDQIEEQGGSSNSSGPGFYLHLNKRLKAIRLAREKLPSEVIQDMLVGLELERLWLSYDDLDDGAERNLSITGVLGTTAYQVLEDRLELNLALGQYLVSETNSSGGIENKHFGLVFKPGVSFKLGAVNDKFQEKVTDRIEIKGRGSYRFADLGEYDFSGFELGLMGELRF